MFFKLLNKLEKLFKMILLWYWNWCREP